MSASAPAAFISYSREDSEFALRLAQDLKAAGDLVWLDQLDIKAGHSWDDAIEDALTVAPQMILILSPASAKSKNVKDEISFALDRGKAIIPVLYKQCELPLRLQRAQQIDFSTNYAAGLATLLRHLKNPSQPYEPQDRPQPHPTPPGPLRGAPFNLLRSRKSRPWLLAAIATLLVCTAASGFVVWRSRQQSRPSARAMSWYDMGVASLRKGDFIASTRSLQMASDLEPHFPMTHVRLAEAWTNLDFQADAQRELLLANPDQDRLAPLDLMYFRAINAAINIDFPTAVKIYTDILGRLPSAEKSAGYVDLGWAHERSSDPVHALENYTQAASLDPDNAAAFMHIGVLQTRQHHTVEGQQAYDRAQAIVYAENSKEGLANLDYQRGYAANDHGDSATARPFLEKALKEAQSIPSVQLQIQALTQLSSATARFDAAQAATYANDAITLARANRLDAWAANGLVRLAVAQLRQNKLEEAQNTLHQGLQLAQETRQFRVVAMANIQLAGLEGRLHHPDQVVAPAQAAFDYYQKNGFFVPAANASSLLIRSERDRGHYPEALQSAQASLQLAVQSGDRELKRQAEEVLGSILLQMEHYPEALGHFQHALTLADAPTSREYDALFAANTLWKLGRTADFEAMLQFVPTNATFAVSVDIERSHSLLSRQQYGAVLALVQHAFTNYPQLEDGDRADMLGDKAIAEAHLHKKTEALRDLEEYRKLTIDQQASEEYAVALTAAEIDLALGLPAQAREAAYSAVAHFSPLGQLDSELRGVCLSTQAAIALKDTTATADLAKRVVDISLKIQQTWDSPMVQDYFSRSDLKALLRTAQK